MNIRNLVLHDFGSHANTAFSPAPLVLVVGENGSGKSTLASQAITYALFGEQAVGDLDSIVRLGSDVAQVELAFELRGNRYRVLRARSRKGRGQSRLELQVGVPDFPNGFNWSPLTGGTVAETQTRLEDLLKLDFASFISSTCIVQGDPGFTARKPAERKAVLSSILRLDDLYAVLKTRALEGERVWMTESTMLSRRVDECRTASELVELKTPDLQAMTAAQAVAIRTVRTLEADLAELQEQIAHLNAQGARAKELTDRRAAVQRELAQLKAEQGKAAVRRQELETAVLQRPQVEKDLLALAAARQRSTEFRDLRREHDQRVAKEHRLMEAVHEALRAHERFQLESGTLVQRAETAVARLENSECPIIDQRPQCVFLVAAYQDADALPDLMRQRRETENELGRRVLSVRNDHAACKQQIEKLGYRVEAHGYADAEVARLSAAERRMAVIEQADRFLEELAQREPQLVASVEAKEAEDLLTLQEIVRLEDVAAELAQLGQSRTGTLTALERARDEERAAVRQVAQLQALVDQLRATASQLERVTAERERAQGEAYLYKELAKAFGPDGIPALVVDNVVADLAAVANRLLQRMPASGEVLQVEIRTLRDLKSVAGQKETLDIIVKVGEQVLPFERLSGGQKVRVEFALRIGLGRLLAHRSGASVETLLIDEGAMGELDAAGRQAFIEAIRSIQGDFKTIIVVSHIAEIQEAGWPVIARVTKENGISRVAVA